MENVVVNGDCLVMLDKIPDGILDLIIVDPPYNANQDYQNDNLPLPEYLDFTRAWMSKCVAKLKDTGSFYCFINDKMLHFFISILNELLVYRNIITWHFEAHINNPGKKYDNRCEYILFYTKSDEYTFNEHREKPSLHTVKRYRKYVDEDGNVPYDALPPQMRGRQSRENYDKNPINIYRGPYQSNYFHFKRQRYKKHVSQKPEELIKILMQVSSNHGDLVLDCFAGSGTTLVVAKKLSRKYIGMEISEEYVNVIKKRLKNTQKPLI